MKRTKKTIYTSLSGFTSKRNEVKSYDELDEEFVEWVNENSVRLLVNRNKAELLAGEELKKYVGVVHEQVFSELAVTLTS